MSEIRSLDAAERLADFSSFKNWYAELQRLCRYHIGLEWESEWKDRDVQNFFDLGYTPKGVIDWMIEKYDLNDLADPYVGIR